MGDFIGSTPFFIIMGVAGLVVAAAFFILHRDPRQGRLSSEEAAYLSDAEGGPQPRPVTLRDWGRLPWEGVREVLLALLDALAHAHARGVIHQDLKPANVLVCGPEDLRPGDLDDGVLLDRDQFIRERDGQCLAIAFRDLDRVLLLK